MTRLGLIWAQSSNGVIGNAGTMPWHLPEDLAHFKELTIGSPVIMGRKTWDSLNPRFRPLPGRRNIVVTRQSSWSADGAEVVTSVDSALAAVAAAPTAWVIGGAEIYRATLAHAEVLEVTEIASHFDGDTFAPSIDSTWTLTHSAPTATSTSGLTYRFLRYER